MIAATAGLLLALLAAGLLERRARDLAHLRLPVRIHVNGTRGKSTVTRQIAAALREAGVRTLAKTTGAAPRLILPDGTERSVRRLAPASIREQLWVQREAVRQGASALVLECMAVDPGLQAVSEHEMVRATIGVVTNVRLDHGDVMGTTVDEVGEALSATVPRSAVLVVGPSAGLGAIERSAAARGTRVVRASSAPGGPGHDEPDWMADNIAIALAVTRELGIADDVALRGIRAATPDPGAVERGLVTIGARQVGYLDATSANDPESLLRVLGTRVSGAQFVFNHRADRPFRLRQFADLPPWPRGDDTLIVTGDRPDWLTWRRVRAALGPERLSFCPLGRLPRALAGCAPEPAEPRLVVFCGNSKGFERRRLLDALTRG